MKFKVTVKSSYGQIMTVFWIADPFVTKLGVMA